MGDGALHRVRIGRDLFVEEAADRRRLDEGKHVNGHFPVFVFQEERPDLPVIDRRQMDAARVHQPRSEGDPLRRIVVAADDEHFQLSLRELHEKLVEQLHRLGGGDGFVVDIPREDDRVRRLAVDDIDNLLEDVLLIFDHGKLVDPFPQMKIR